MHKMILLNDSIVFFPWLRLFKNFRIL